ncbi:MAG TPA: hypothetical protein K8V91_08360 [[Clostridium] spiroforme]|uniref:Uncharacterized protein n=1 Tax=Thomasclavelia spiroformis TaxID=29348 RepID=A0A921GAX8_9FIRM|nr:hypothetical protein [Thomasclavelia spiroformis]
MRQRLIQVRFAALDEFYIDFYIMEGTGHNGFLLPVVNWMGWWFAISFWTTEKQEGVFGLVAPPMGGGY